MKMIVYISPYFQGIFDIFSAYFSTYIPPAYISPHCPLIGVYKNPPFVPFCWLLALGISAFPTIGF